MVRLLLCCVAGSTWSRPELSESERERDQLSCHLHKRPSAGRDIGKVVVHPVTLVKQHHEVIGNGAGGINGLHRRLAALAQHLDLHGLCSCPVVCGSLPLRIYYHVEADCARLCVTITYRFSAGGTWGGGVVRWRLPVNSSPSPGYGPSHGSDTPRPN